MMTTSQFLDELLKYDHLINVRINERYIDVNWKVSDLYGEVQLATVSSINQYRYQSYSPSSEEVFSTLNATTEDIVAILDIITRYAVTPLDYRGSVPTEEVKYRMYLPKEFYDGKSILKYNTDKDFYYTSDSTVGSHKSRFTAREIADMPFDTSTFEIKESM